MGLSFSSVNIKQGHGLPKLKENLAELLTHLHEGVKMASLWRVSGKVVLLEGLGLPRSVSQHLGSQIGGLLLDGQRELGALGDAIGDKLTMGM